MDAYNKDVYVKGEDQVWERIWREFEFSFVEVRFKINAKGERKKYPRREIYFLIGLEFIKEV